MQQAHVHRSLVAKTFAHPHRNVRALGIEHGMKVADFGAGSGAYTLGIAEALSGSGTVYAIDIQKDLLRRIKTEARRRHMHNIEVIWSDLEKSGGSKIRSGTVDVVLISNLLFQLDDKKAPLVEARRILKPRGRLVIIDWDESSKGIGPHRDHRFGKHAAIALARGIGFEPHEEFSVGAHHYGLIFACSPIKDRRKDVVQ